MADRDPPKEKNRKEGRGNPEGARWKRKEASAQKRKYVPRQHAQPRSEGAKVASAGDPTAAPGPGAPTGPGPSGAAPALPILADPVDRGDGTGGAAGIGPLLADLPRPEDIVPVALRRDPGIHLPIGQVLPPQVPGDIGPPPPPLPPIHRRNLRRVGNDGGHESREHEPDLEVAGVRRLYYHFTAHSDNLRAPAYERVLPKNSLVGRNNDFPWFLLAFVPVCGCLFLAAAIWHSVLLFGCGLVLCACLFIALANVAQPEVVQEYRRTLTITPRHFERTHPKLRVFQDSFKDPGFAAMSIVTIDITVESVYWDRVSWRLATTDAELTDAAERLQYLPVQITAPEHLWASIIAAVSRLDSRTEEQVEISVDQCIRSLRSNVSSHYQNELEGYTVDLAVAAMHAYRSMRYRQSGNWIPDRL